MNHWEKFWSAIGKILTCMLISRWVLIVSDKLTALMPIKWAIYALCVSIVFGLISLGVWLCSMTWWVDAMLALRAIWRERNTDK